jgi:adenylate cyclase class IV
MENKGEKNIIDVYYDTPEAVFFQKWIFIRIRNNSRIDIKYNKSKVDIKHLSCNEYSFNLPLNKTDEHHITDFFKEHILKEKQNDIFKQFNLQHFVTIDKQRKMFHNQHIEVVIDDVAWLWKYIEIEALDDNKNMVLDTAEKLNLLHIPVWYVELWLRKNNFPLYKKGKYLLTEDR